MSSYPVLDNKPIDQWKVTELKEELKRRKLPLRGLKDDLIRRLDEAIRIERESVNENVNNGMPPDPEPEIEATGPGTVTVVEAAPNLVEESIDEAKDNNVTEPRPVAAENLDQSEHVNETTDETVVPGGLDDNPAALDPDKAALQQVKGQVEDSVVYKTTMETTSTVSESVVSEVVVSVQEPQDAETQKEDGSSHTQLSNEDSEAQLENDNLKHQMKTEDSKALHDDAMIESSVSNNQVPEVSPILGIQVNSDSISTDSVSINEKNELKDNIIADNVNLEIDNVKPEMLQPPSSNLVQDGGDSHPMDIIEPYENKVSTEEIDHNKANADTSKKNDSVEVDNSKSRPVGTVESCPVDVGDSLPRDVGDIRPVDVDDLHPLDVGDSHPDPVDVVENKVSIREMDDKIVNADTSKTNDSSEVVDSEKLNLDRSSGDDSMEEDALDNKQIDSKYNSEEVNEKNEKLNAGVKEEGFVDVVGDYSSAPEKTIPVDNKQSLTAVTVKRKLNDQETRANNELSKRQRRWNSESIKVPEPKSSNLTSTTPKDLMPSATLRRSFSRSDSTVSDDTPKDRVVLPSQNSPTNSLRIDRFLRPFTLKAVQELLGKTGSVKSFWMDHIKTHCYVTYSSVEEAIETRNAVYNLQWPPNGGRLLLADFVDPQEVKMRVEAPPATPPAPANTAPAVTTAVPLPPHQAQPSPRNQVPKQLPPPPSLPPPPPLSRELPLPPPPPLPVKQDPPIVTLDDLFKKTKATPRIYYLPLTDEQVADKRAALGQHFKQ